MSNRIEKVLEVPSANGKNQEKTFTKLRVSAPPERVANFIRRVIRGEKFYPGPERRLSLRYPITMPVKAWPLDDKMHTNGDAFLAVTRDISLGGLCMYHLESVDAQFLQLELTNQDDETLDVVMEVVRCRQTGPFFEIAGRFVGQA
jgi:hypothetical protein